jgi:hypothetical protein
MALNQRLSLVEQDNLFDWFHDRVDEAARHQRAPVSQETLFYLSQLLAEEGRNDPAETPTTLVELHAQASAAPWAASITKWRCLGDRALLTLGFFRENLRRRAISGEYYAQMGATAYGSVSRRLRMPENSPHDVFAELADRFVPCTEVIAEVRAESCENTDGDIVRLYEEWLATGSPRLAERLRALGVVPVRFAASG